MSLEADALAGAGLTPAIDRIKNLCSLSTQLRVDSIKLDIQFARNLISLMERCRDMLESHDQVAQATEHAELPAIRQAIRDYHFALDSRAHGDVAASHALNAIQQALDMPWWQGREAKARKEQS